jgi:hypothetical protein
LSRDVPQAERPRACGPRWATKRLKLAMDSAEIDRSQWAIEARIWAIVGSVAGSKLSVLSGVRAWLTFHGSCLKRTDAPFPPKIEDLLCWAAVFR